VTAYYNEWDKNAAAWLRQLIKNGLIADGEVDERSITEVTADDLRGFTQIHLFAGIGGWSAGLRIAGWADDRKVLTASLPCQPFSVAGLGKGVNDERHLLPHVLDLIRELKYPVIFGEQVENAIAHGWSDELSDELGVLGYETAMQIIPAAALGGYHIRSRLWWVGKL
jgi:DNA (cytosine-5)-methyltransferase 1